MSTTEGDFRELRSRHLFQLFLDVDYDAAVRIGKMPLGGRGIFPVRGGTFEGERLSGTVLPGADWVLFRNDGSMVIDVRIALKTDDGATISMAYTGLSYARTEEAAAAGLRREPVDYADTYLRTTPTFETADPRYDWLNRVVAVANGYRLTGRPSYHVFEIL